MKKRWYDIKAAAGSKPAVLDINEDIGMWGVSAAALVRDLKSCSGQLNVNINSLGGSVIEGIAVYNALRFYANAEGNSVVMTVTGIAASIATTILMAGTKIRMPANTFLMVHKPFAGVEANADEMRDYADLLDKMESSLVGTFVARTGKSDADIRAMLSEVTWMTAAEAVAAGFADEVIDPIDMMAACDEDRVPENVLAVIKASAKGPAEDPPADDPPAEDPPADDPPADDPPADDPPAEPAFADDANALIVAAGLESHAPAIVLASVSLDQVKARVAVAKEIVALCALAKKPGESDPLIKSGATVAAARAHLVALLAAADEATHTDGTKKNSDQPTFGVQPAAVNTADIWAARRNQGVKK